MKRSIEEIKAVYEARVAEVTAELKEVKQRINRISLLRIAVVAGGVAGAVMIDNTGWKWSVAAVAAAYFLLLMWKHNRQFARRDYLQKVIEINRQELAALMHDVSAFDDGREFIDPSHRYTLDLDVFGPRSLFQYLNRTCTPPGKKRLAAWLTEHEEDEQAIRLRQDAVKKLAEATRFREEFRATGLLHRGKAADEEELLAWAKEKSSFRTKRLFRVLPKAVSAVNVFCLVAVLMGWMSGSQWAVVWTLFVMLAFCFTRRITKWQAGFNKKLGILGTYGKLLSCIDEGLPCGWIEIEELVPGYEVLDGIRHSIHANGWAAHEIKYAHRLMHELDQRNNMFMYAILNGLFFWEIHQVMRIEEWRERYADRMPQWLDAIGEVDALCSLATFAYNRPDALFPTPTTEEGGFSLRAEGMAHPLMPVEQCVANDLLMETRPAFIIVTGANMAGKSTYLRTVGVNFLLACIGAPVCARSMEFTPRKLVTSLRTSDSLSDNTSYFFAELKRLKMIIDRLQGGEELFILLDEILKGTNSLDKQRGSMALVKQLMALRANGIIATHDLLLGTLIDSFPGKIQNFCFEADIVDDELTFSYRMRPGVARNMNACFLMKKMGIALAD